MGNIKIIECMGGNVMADMEGMGMVYMGGSKMVDMEGNGMDGKGMEMEGQASTDVMGKTCIEVETRVIETGDRIIVEG